jgi:hypothetical protein
VEAHSTGLHYLLTIKHSGFLAVGTPKNIGVFSADQRLASITATSGEYLSEVSSETRNFR